MQASDAMQFSRQGKNTGKEVWDCTSATLRMSCDAALLPLEAPIAMVTPRSGLAEPWRRLMLATLCAAPVDEIALAPEAGRRETDGWKASVVPASAAAMRPAFAMLFMFLFSRSIRRSLPI